MNHTVKTSISARSIIVCPIVSLALSVLMPLQHASAQSLQLLVPAYFYPGGSSLAYWNQLDAAASQAPVNVIFNPATGPGAATDSDYTQAVTNLLTAGGKTFAYINTDYGNRSLAAMEQDVNTYLQLYPGLESGFFLDQMTNDTDPAHLAIYNSLYNYIKAENSAFSVIGNPGTNAPEDYLTEPAADTIVTFEDVASAYPAYQPEPYMLSSNPNDFANIIYDEPTVAGMQSDLTTALARNAGYIYVTDDTLPNPYGALPSYWNQEVAAIHATAVPEPSSMATTIGLLGLGSLVLRRRRLMRNGSADRSSHRLRI